MKALFGDVASGALVVSVRFTSPSPFAILGAEVRSSIADVGLYSSPTASGTSGIKSSAGISVVVLLSI